MDNLNLFILNITLTLRCTLRCKYCAADITKYDVPPHFDTDYLCDVIDKCFQIVDTVERFQLSGGEPLLHKGFSAILEKAMQYQSRFKQLGIFTNGTLLPSTEILKQIESYNCNEKFKVYISHYGEHSSHADEMALRMAESGIPCDIKVYYGENQHFDGWIDYGDYKPQGYSEYELRNAFANCAVNKIGGIWSCRYGELHRCTRSASGMDLGKVPREDEDYISLFADIPTAEYRQKQRDKLRMIMQKPYLTACRYCTGDFGTNDKQKRIRAGEQI